MESGELSESHHTPDSAIVRESLVRKESFGVLMSRYEAKLDRYLRRLGVRAHEDREDVLQEVFIKVYRNLNEYDESFAFSSWIYRIAHNECMSFYRKRNVRPEGHLVDEGEEILLHVPGEERDQESDLESSINGEHLNTALLGMEQKYRDVVILRYFEHKEYEEISDILKIPSGSVATLLHRAKKKLKGELAHLNT